MESAPPWTSISGRTDRRTGAVMALRAIAGVKVVSGEEDILIISDDGVIIRMPVKDINSYSRTAQGVILMRLQEGVKVISIARTDHEGEEIEEPVEDEIPEAGSDQGGRTEPEQ